MIPFDDVIMNQFLSYIKPSIILAKGYTMDEIDYILLSRDVLTTLHLQLDTISVFQFHQ